MRAQEAANHVGARRIEEMVAELPDADGLKACYAYGQEIGQAVEKACG